MSLYLCPYTCVHIHASWYMYLCPIPEITMCRIDSFVLYRCPTCTYILNSICQLLIFSFFPPFPPPNLGHISLGALGDSFYEYLLKSWLMTSKHDVDARDMYYTAAEALEKHLLKRTSDGTLFITDVKNGRPDNKMQHLVSW